MGTGGKKKKGKSDADARTEECQSWVSRRPSDLNLNPLILIYYWAITDGQDFNCLAQVEKHRDHIQKLETLLRMLDNDQVCEIFNLLLGHLHLNFPVLR